MKPLTFLPLLIVACAAQPSAATPDASECQRSAARAERAAVTLAAERYEMMKVMRFGSQAQMEAYVAENERLDAEALRMVVLMNDLGERYGFIENTPVIPEELDLETVDAMIAEADTCATELLK